MLTVFEFSPTNITGTGFLEAFPQECLMPLELYINHVHDLIGDDTACRKVVEISGKEHFLHKVPEPLNESMRPIFQVVAATCFIWGSTPGPVFLVCRVHRVLGEIYVTVT